MSGFNQRIESLRAKTRELAREYAELADALDAADHLNESESVNACGAYLEDAANDLFDATLPDDAEGDDHA